MHILDSSIGPQTYLPAYAVMAGIWAWASKRVGESLRMRQVPLLALGAAFSFVIMMINIPTPGGTTGHAVGAVLIAILLGPWAAVIAVSLALVVQALLFGDGGITAIGANCFTMAVLMTFVGWWTYRLLIGKAAAGSRRQIVAGAVGGYTGICAAAFSTAVMLGIQPSIAHNAAGNALYFPLGLRITIPVMLGEHLLFFGFVEAAVTGLVLAYVARTEPSLLSRATPRRTPAYTRLAIALGVLVLLTPLGLYLPHLCKAGGAWGEWAPEEIPAIMAKYTGQQDYLPHRMAQLSAFWKAPLPDYAPSGWENAPLWQLSLVYLGCGVAGALLLALLMLTLRRIFARKDPDDCPADVDAPIGSH